MHEESDTNKKGFNVLLQPRIGKCESGFGIGEKSLVTFQKSLIH